ncbi:hypothetical protein F2Q69_00035555 [Brassica cretica]|uniref:Uncharacterized protein n=1 Tax=Brassica cretica TaxID=69181 RepID=A0A8S9SQE8_BRACR|nr:hypothetical protein F2Q69_00035555 [Brassica cretica]
MFHCKKTPVFRRQISSVCPRNNGIPRTYRREWSSEISRRKVKFPRNFLGKFRGNTDNQRFRGHSEETFPRTFRRYLLGYFRWNGPRKHSERKEVSEYSDELWLSEYSEKPFPSEYSEEVYPSGYSEKLRPSEYSEEMYPSEYPEEVYPSEYPEG